MPRRTPAGDDEELTIEQLEQRLIERTHTRHQGNLTAVARALGISLSTLKRQVKALGLDRARMSQTEATLSRSE